MQSDNPSAAILVIGDEILSGRTREGNAHHLAQVLTATGFDLREIRIVADDQDQIVEAVRALDKSLGGAFDLLFTSGGIGPTHDDITADSVAIAHGTTAEVNEAARALLQERCERMGTELTLNRLRMARIPLGATLIDNAVSAAPGFSIGNTHVMAGVPEVFRGMVDWLIPRLAAGRPVRSETVEVRRGESDVAEELKAVAAEFPDVSMGSYPYHDERGWGTNLVVRGLDADRVAVAMAELKRRLSL
ncbi:MAG: competence/damage-inducible protein A [Paracoccus sp. (in: a-proteobacteria)]|jgi:molybdenum cofactor synthesis domain-containing protein|uniref:competence/damage-inducible protein A n=2 Tax=Paracoccus TaxID=265 RepID=UPI000C536B71|nr:MULTISPECIES: molybdopterin-binding protein [unclassified Paracoccus (in: a-proteobacteria)]MAN55980.1 competence/damage-inducible protein A [Paracoccus sp. (in: a-proteobacteria)]MBA47698.1 competence/damage-inducible protein A [Paracoccus sp. (in: a-proteobacteria)]MCS5601641.1 molybdopterin-binding protein [Paracoccus sp. (in: a-proteobacteria)]|tara:strand:- start:8982 stop:9722 length:741 start_codon:yes stop_codon:yes gene_type:complete